jgi:hypothetical protein
MLEYKFTWCVIISCCLLICIFFEDTYWGGVLLEFCFLFGSFIIYICVNCSILCHLLKHIFVRIEELSRFLFQISQRSIFLFWFFFGGGVKCDTLDCYFKGQKCEILEAGTPVVDLYYCT